MMTPDQLRLDRAATQPRFLQLLRALHGLRSPLRFMMSGAHPDDERAQMLAALHIRDGWALSYVCSTRGEGGQNDLGTERGAELGALRTAEMEAACDVLSMRLYWLSEGADDPITDWRFSKSGTETLEKWGYDRTLARMVYVLRRDKPDVLCPTFLDVPGQHGHHRAMTRIAFDAFEAAADQTYTRCDLPAWAASKLYLPAWSGAGRAYDDDTPPPEATVVIDGRGEEPLTGWPYALIGEIAHGKHRSQGMGHWPVEASDFPLALAASRVGSDAQDPRDNLTSMADLGLAEFEDIASRLVDALSDTDRIIGALDVLDEMLRGARVGEADTHRIALKRLQVAHARVLAKGLVPPSAPRDSWLRPGQVTCLDRNAALALPDGWQGDAANFGPTDAAQVPDGYRDCYDPLVPPLPALKVDLDGVRTFWPLERPVLALPEYLLRLGQTRVLINIAAGQRNARIKIVEQRPDQAQLSLKLPEGWYADTTPGALSVTLPSSAQEARLVLPLYLDGAPAVDIRPIDYPHIRPTQFVQPAKVELGIVDVPLLSHSVGYIGAGLDTVATRLAELGAEVVDLSENPSAEAFAGLRTIIVGVHAFGFNCALHDATIALHDWVRAGGNLLTLYHRPWDKWDPDKTPLDRLVIGQPSVRWRVTNPNAKVTMLAPEHALLTGIKPDDFEGWHKERGLYFARDWSSEYTPLLAMADEGEPPLEGALLTGQFGTGRHTHCALNLHHQLEQMVPGAIRLFVRLLETDISLDTDVAMPPETPTARR